MTWPIITILMLLMLMPVRYSADLLEDKESTVITCITSWGTGGTSRLPVELPPDRINDGYCDCLDTAADETKTDACAGVNNWDGLATTPETRKKTT